MNHLDMRLVRDALSREYAAKEIELQDLLRLNPMTFEHDRYNKTRRNDDRLPRSMLVAQDYITDLSDLVALLKKIKSQIEGIQL